MTERVSVITEKLNIISMAPNSWDGPWMNRQQLLSRLGRKHEILYTNGLWTVWDCHEKAWRDAPLQGRTRRQDHVVLDIASRVLLRWPTFSLLDRMVIRIGVRRWKLAMENGESRPRVAYIFHPQYYPYIAALEPDFIVYHAYDMFSLTPGWNSELVEQQNKLLAMADLIVASSEVIADELGSLSGKPVEVLPNAVNFSAFSNVGKGRNSEPPDLIDIAHPRIGYVGNLNLKVDFSLIAQLACLHPGWQFIFVGGQGKFDDYTQQGVDQCNKLDNVHFLGAKHYQDIPRYVCNMDVNVMCYRVDDNIWTRGGYPLKLHEYLAAGLPVVSAEIPSVLPFKAQLAIAHSLEQWETSIESALQGKGVGDFESRRAVAQQNSWDARVVRLNDCLAHMLARKPCK